MTNSAPLDTTIEVVTPENIAFDYQLAGPFRRLPAYLFDIAIRIGSFILIVALVIFIGGMTGLFSGNIMPSLAAASLLFLYFLQSWFYGVFFETYFNGRTPGKWLCGLRVISDDGHPITGMQALLRNLLRAIDLMPAATLISLDPENFYLQVPLMTGMVGLFTMMMTRRLQRLGDLAAGTMVVIDERNWALPVVKVDDPRVAALATFIPPDFRATPTMAKALAGYTERRLFLSPSRRREIARHLAVPLGDRFEFRRDIDPDLLLYALYYRTFLADRSDEAPLGALAGFSPLAKDAAMGDLAGGGHAGGEGATGGEASEAKTFATAASAMPTGAHRAGGTDQPAASRVEELS